MSMFESSVRGLFPNGIINYTEFPENKKVIVELESGCSITYRQMGSLISLFKTDKIKVIAAYTQTPNNQANFYYMEVTIEDVDFSPPELDSEVY